MRFLRLSGEEYEGMQNAVSCRRMKEIFPRKP